MNYCIYGKGRFNIRVAVLRHVALVYLLVCFMLFLVMSPLSPLASAVPVHDAVELCNCSVADNPTGVAAVNSDSIWVMPASAYYPTKFVEYGSSCNEKLNFTVDDDEAYCSLACPYDSAYLYMHCANCDMYRVLTDGTGLEKVFDTPYLSSPRGMDWHNGVFYGSCDVVNRSFIYREPYADGECWVVLKAGIGYDSPAIAYRSDGSFVVATQDVDQKLRVFNLSYGLVQEYNISFSTNVNNLGMTFDENEILWIASGVPNRLYKLYLPNLPDYEDSYSVSVSGKTRDITGGLVSGVLVEIHGYSDTSDNLGDYLITGALITDSMPIDASKTGYENYNVTLHGITENGNYIHDVYMIPEGELENGDIGGVLYDYCDGVIISDALVNLYNDDNSDLNYTYSSEYGYYKFSDLINVTNYTLFASKNEYENSEKYSFLAYNTTYYVKNIWLLPLSGCDEGLPEDPTPTPTLGADDKPVIDGIRMIFELFGLGDYMGYIFAFLCIAVMGTLFGGVCGGNTLGFLIGGFFGYVIDVAIGWLPIWTVAVVICVTVFYLVKQVSKE